MQQFPLFYRVKQDFLNPTVGDLGAAVSQACGGMNLKKSIKPGDRIAITAGSRGIRNIREILRTVGEEVRALGGEPFLAATMGSHGGGTAAGMLEVLNRLGLSEQTVGMPIEASDRVVDLGSTESGFSVFCAAEPYHADGIIVINRVKPHTAYRGPHESGLIKMMCVGMGRQTGAAAVHLLGPAAMARAVKEIGLAILERAPVIGGIAIVENGNEEIAIVEGVEPARFAQTDARLLQEATEMAPTLPVDDIDLLVVEEMGKNYSGTGMDTNVVGRIQLEGIPEPERPRIKRIVILGLSPASHGNANGVGLADFTTRRLFDAVDLESTNLNALTSNFLSRARMPLIMPDDEAAVVKAWESLRLPDAQTARVIIIHDTLDIQEIYVSEALKEECAQLAHVSVQGSARLTFDRGRMLLQANAQA